MSATVEPVVIRGKAFTPDDGSHSPNGEACIMEALSAETEASIEDGLALLDALLELQAVAA